MLLLKSDQVVTLSQLQLLHELLLLSSQRLRQFIAFPSFRNARSAPLLHQLRLLDQIELELLLQLLHQRLQLFATEIRQFLLLLFLVQQHIL